MPAYNMLTKPHGDEMERLTEKAIDRAATGKIRNTLLRIVVDMDGRLLEDPVPMAEAKAADSRFNLFDFAKEAS